MKKFILLFLLISLYSCSEDHGLLQAPVNDYAGHWTMQFEGDTPGAATIVILQNGEVANGINLDYTNLFLTLRTDMFCSVTGRGDLQGTLKLYSKDLDKYINVGTIRGSLAGEPAGSYDIEIPIEDHAFTFSGTWSASRL